MREQDSQESGRDLGFARPCQQGDRPGEPIDAGYHGKRRIAESGAPRQDCGLGVDGGDEPDGLAWAMQP